MINHSLQFVQRIWFTSEYVSSFLQIQTWCPLTSFQIISILAIFKTILTNEMIIITFIIATFIVKRIISIICLDKNIKMIRINMIFISPLALSCFNIASITMYVPVRPTWWWRWWQWQLIIMIAMLTMMKNDNWSLRWCWWWNWPRHCNGRPGALQTPARLRTISWWTTEPGFRIINAWSWWSAPVLLWSIWYHIQQHIAGNR